jgi:virginiamycin A acetyltransferase
MPSFRVSEELLQDLHDRTILLAYNSPAPTPNTYGWLRAGDTVKLTQPSVVIEANSGLYGGKYAPLVGGRKYSGFCAMGAFSYSYSALPEGLRVGRYCSISSGLRFLDSTHPSDLVTTSAISFRPKNKLYSAFVTPAIAQYAEQFDIQGGKPFPVIGNDVWIGANATLALGITIGHGAIIASGSVVTADVPAYAIVAGNPAKIRRMRFSDELALRLQMSRWWEVDPRFIFEQNFRDPAALCDALDANAGRIARFDPPRIDVAVYASHAQALETLA